MIFNYEIQVDVAGASTIIQTRDYATLPLLSFGKENDSLELEFEVTNKILDNSFHRILEIIDDDGLGERLGTLNAQGVMYNKTKPINYGSASIKIPEGETRIIKLLYYKDENNQKRIQVTDVTNKIVLDKRIFEYRIEYDKNPVLSLNTYNGNGSKGFDFNWLKVNGEKFDLKELAQTDYNKGDRGTIINFHTYYSSIKPIGGNPEYSTDLDYIINRMRADNVTVYHPVSIKTTNDIRAISNCLVNILGGKTDENNNSSFTTDLEGNLVMNLKNGVYDLSITKAGYIALASQLTVSFRGGLTIYELVLNSSTSNQFLKLPSDGYNKRALDNSELYGRSEEYLPFEKIQNSSITFNSLQDLRKTIKGEVGDKVKTVNYYSDISGGGLEFEMISKDYRNYNDNAGTTIVTDLGDVYQAVSIYKTIDAAAFGVKGDGQKEDNKQLQRLFDYASDNRLQIVFGAGKEYVIGAINEEDRIVLNDNNYYLNLDALNSIIKPYWQVKSMPMRLLEKVLIGTFVSYADDQYTIDDDRNKVLTYTSNNNIIKRKILLIESQAAFNALNSTTINNEDYILYYPQKYDANTSQGSLRKIIDNTTSPVTYEEDSITNADSKMRDRFFIANNDLSKRFKIYDNFDNQSNNIIGNLTTEEFSPNENLYFYCYVSDRKIIHNDSNIEINRDIDSFTTESLYRARGTNKWLLYNEGDIPISPFLVQRCNHFEVHINLDGERQDSGNIDLSVNVDDNVTINKGDQIYPLSHYRFFEFTSSSGQGPDSTINFDNSTFKNFNARWISRLYQANFKSASFRNCKFYDSGSIDIQNTPSQKTKTKVIIDNLIIENPYFHTFRSKGITVRGCNYQITNVKANNTLLAIMGYGSDQGSISNIIFTECLSRKLDKTNPFFNGKSLPEKNGGIRILLGKSGDTGYSRKSFLSLHNIKVLSIAPDNFQIDLDPVTGTFIDTKYTELWYTRIEDGGGNMKITNCDIIGTISYIKHYTSQQNNFQSSGGLNLVLKNNQFKHHPDITFISQSIYADIIDGLEVLSLQEKKLNQQKFYHKTDFKKQLTLSAKVIKNITGYIPVTVIESKEYNEGWFTDNNITDDYDTVNSKGVFDIGYGGQYTARSPQPTETDSQGNKKIVPTSAELINIENIDFGSGFYEKYKGGLIEVANESVKINSTKSLNKRYKNTVKKPSLSYYWIKENNDSDRPFIPNIRENIVVPEVRIYTALLDRNIQQYINYSNVFNIKINSSFPRNWIGGHGKTVIKYENCTFFKLSGAKTTRSIAYSFLRAFSGTVNGRQHIFNQGYDFPFINIFNNCKYVSSFMGELYGGRNEFLAIDPKNVNLLDNASNWNYVHPQMRNIHHKNASIIDFDNMYLGHSENNQILTILLDEETPDGAGLLINGKTYVNKGCYVLKINKIYINEIYQSSVIRVLNRPNINTTGSILNLSYSDLYNMGINDTKNATTYTVVKPIVGKTIRCSVKFTQAEIDGMPNKKLSFTGFNVNEVNSSESLIADTEMYMIVWCDSSVYGNEIIRMKIATM